jgi:hypothetical protein
MPAHGWMYTAGHRRSRSVWPRPKKMSLLSSSMTSTASPVSPTPFTYDPKTSTWQNQLDNVVKGVAAFCAIQPDEAVKQLKA